MINHCNVCQGLIYEREKMGNHKKPRNKNKSKKRNNLQTTNYEKNINTNQNTSNENIDNPVNDSNVLDEIFPPEIVPSEIAPESQTKTHPIITGVIIELIILSIVGIAGWIIGLWTLPQKVSLISEALDKHIENYNVFNPYINGRVDQLFSAHIAKLEVSVVLNTNAIDISYLPQYVSSNKASMEPTSINENSVLYKDDKIEYLAKDLINKKIIIPYTENDKDIFFYGQFDDKFKWDGDCLINVYNKNKLILAASETYDHGIRIKYEQIFSDKGNWIYSKRVTEDNINTGDTWIYSGVEGYTQTISYKDPDENELILPDILKNDTRGKLISRYHGNTSEGSYNDTTGTAYLIQFDSEGIVRTLYHGDFLEGKFNSESKHAWYITRNPETNTNYMYYMGKFSGGDPYPEYSEECAYFENPLTRNTFNRVMSGREYDCEMTWAEECFLSDDN